MARWFGVGGSVGVESVPKGPLLSEQLSPGLG